MQKPDKVTDATYQAFVKAMKNILGPSANPSRNYLKREIENPTHHVGCFTCMAKQTTLYKYNNEMYCGSHRPSKGS